MKKCLFIVALIVAVLANAQKTEGLTADSLQAKTIKLKLFREKPPVKQAPDSTTEADEPVTKNDIVSDEKLQSGQNENKAFYSALAMMGLQEVNSNICDLHAGTGKRLLNKRVLEVNNDSLAIAGITYADKDGLKTWLKPLKNGEWAVCFFNNDDKPHELFFVWRNTTISYLQEKFELNVSRNNFLLKDLWLDKEIGTTAKPVNAIIGAKDVLMLRLVKQVSKRK